MADLGSLGQTSPGEWIAIVLASIEVAKRVASVTPGKTDDEIVSKVEKIVRSLIDAFAGQHTDRNDPGMIKTKETDV